MEAVRRAVATILSTFTGIPEERLEEFEPLSLLLEAAGSPPNRLFEVNRRFGLLQYHWYWDASGPHLDISVTWSSVRERLTRRLPISLRLPPVTLTSGRVAEFDFSELVSIEQTGGG